MFNSSLNFSFKDNEFGEDSEMKFRFFPCTACRLANTLITVEKSLTTSSELFYKERHEYYGELYGIKERIEWWKLWLVEV
jgi:hypothetical protein